MHFLLAAGRCGRCGWRSWFNQDLCGKPSMIRFHHVGHEWNERTGPRLRAWPTNLRGESRAAVAACTVRTFQRCLRALSCSTCVGPIEQQHFVRFFGLIFLKSIAKIAAVCIDLSKTELSLQSRALFGDSCCQNWFQWIRFTESLPTENKRFFYHQKQKGFLFQIPFNILQTSRECLVLSTNLKYRCFLTVGYPKPLVALLQFTNCGWFCPPFLNPRKHENQIQIIPSGRSVCFSLKPPEKNTAETLCDGPLLDMLLGFELPHKQWLCNLHASVSSMPPQTPPWKSEITGFLLQTVSWSLIYQRSGGANCPLCFEIVFSELPSGKLT